MPWKVQELGKDVPTQQEMIEIAGQISNDSHRAFFILTYLTAGRVEEVLSLKRNQLAFETRRERPVLTIYHMLNEKHKKRKMKTFHIPLDKEGKFIDLIVDYINSIGENERLFPFKSRQRAWQILKKIGYFPHFLRHIRLTHLVTIYDLSDQLLVRFAGWTDSQPARFYIELKAEDILEKM